MPDTLAADVYKHLKVQKRAPPSMDVRARKRQAVVRGTFSSLWQKYRFLMFILEREAILLPRDVRQGVREEDKEEEKGGDSADEMEGIPLFPAIRVLRGLNDE